MDKKSRWIIGIILAVIIGAGAYVYFAKDSNETNPPADSQKVQEPAADNKPAANENNTAPEPGRYVDYSPQVVADAKGDILLFFHAPWCPQCRAMEESINTTSLPNGLTILKVDYDSNQALRQQYGVTLQTTFVKIDKEGNKIKSFVAYDEPTFEAVRRELLP